jgi:co-chaperonin GroES (HSP10)
LYLPILDRILCRDISTIKQFDSAGNLIPEQFQVPSFEAEVLAVGSGVFIGGVTLEMPIKVGDVVKYSAYACDFSVSDNNQWVQGGDFTIRVPDVVGIKKPESSEIVN